MSDMKAHQKSTSAEWKFNNQVDKMMPSVAVNQLLFSDILSLPGKLMKKVAMPSGINLFSDLETWISAHQDKYGYCYYRYQQIDSNMALFLRATSKVPGFSLITSNHFHHRRGIVLFSQE